MDFDDYSDIYDEEIKKAIGFAGQGHDFYMATKADAILEIARSSLGDLSKIRALDFGCGIGALSALLVDHVKRLDGVDVSHGSLVQTRQNVPAGHFLHYQPGNPLPFDDAEFDLVFACCVFHHIPLHQRWANAKEIERVLKPGGVFVIAEHNPWNPATRLVVSRCEFDKDAVLLDHRDARRLIREAGLDFQGCRQILFLPFRSRFAVRANRMLAWLPLGAQYLSWGLKKTMAA